ncbi:MAG TPA: DUF4037 domain-containing protein [Gaiellaceae bacterium]|jgi:hypothetical protein|nr:DUF4037 domain-containing protein [Gaiellaceae bacterium]
MPLRGLELAHRFYVEAVQPILERRFPGLEHAAALIGPGSEVLGYDDDVSTDHHWGPRVQLFVQDADVAPEVESALAHELPMEFGGFSTNFGLADEHGARLLVPIEHGPVAHRVETLDLRAYLRERVGVDPLDGFGVVDWLVTPSQRLLEVTAGAVFVDPTGDLTRVRALLAWYPHDVWLVVMAGHWRRVAQLEHLAGRTASRVVAALLVRELMRLALLQERRYPPYAKWLGTAYASLGRPEAQALEAALAAGSWPEREDRLVEAYEAVAQRHAELKVTAPVEPTVRQYWNRPYRVLFADRFADALGDAVSDSDLRERAPAGAIDAIVDNAHVLTRPALWRRLANLYDRA